MSSACCLTNSQFMGYLSGTMTHEESQHAEDHLDQCPTCRFLLVSLVKVLPPVCFSRSAPTRAVDSTKSADDVGLRRRGKSANM